jgi:hypothetical protein
MYVLLSFVLLCLIDMILDDMIANGSLAVEKRSIVRNALLLKHVHQVRLLSMFMFIFVFVFTFCFFKHEKEFHRHLHSQEMRKQLPFTRSLAEFSRNRSQKDVTVTSADQIVSTGNTVNTTIPTNLHQSPAHPIKGRNKDGHNIRRT